MIYTLTTASFRQLLIENYPPSHPIRINCELERWVARNWIEWRDRRP